MNRDWYALLPLLRSRRKLRRIARQRRQSVKQVKASLRHFWEVQMEHDREAQDRAGCERCGCCSAAWTNCDNCGGAAFDGHDCGEDACCCAEPDDNLVCYLCSGRGGWDVCLGYCDADGRHRAARHRSARPGTR